MNNFAPVPPSTMDVSTCNNDCFNYPMLFNCQNPQPKVGEFFDYFDVNTSEKQMLVNVILQQTPFRLKEVLKIQKAQLDYQQRFRIVLVTLDNTLIEAIVVLNRYGELTLEGKYYYRLSQIVVN